MTLHDPKLGEGANIVLPFLESIRHQIAKLPQSGQEEDRAIWRRHDIDYFSAARTYITYKVKLAEHFPEPIPTETFDFLVDLMIHEWLSRRVGSDRPADYGVSHSAALSPRIQHALTLGLITIEVDPDDQDRRILALTRHARGRLNVFFDFMADYISAL